MKLSLYAAKHGKRYEGQLGSLQVATWLGPKGVTAPMQEGTDSSHVTSP